MKIAFIGQSGVGKDYIVDILKKEYGYCRISFSDQLKKLAVKIYPWMERDYPAEVKEKPLNITVNGELITMTPREIWLHLNNLRKVEDGLFVRMLQEELNLMNITDIVISDIRTMNEYEWCKKNDFTIVAVTADTPAHPDNSFDDFVREVIKDGGFDYYFENEFDGDAKIKDFIETCFFEDYKGKHYV